MNTTNDGDKLRREAKQTAGYEAHFLGRIAAQADEAARVTGVPVATLLVMGYMESALGCDPRSGGCWGAPISPARRLTAGTSMHAARALAWGYRRCETTEGAVAHFRYGRCTTPRRHGAGYTPAQAVDLIVRVVARAAGGVR